MKKFIYIFKYTMYNVYKIPITLILLGSVFTQFPNSYELSTQSQLRDLPSNAVINFRESNGKIYCGTGGGLGYIEYIEEFTPSFYTVDSNNLPTGGNPALTINENVIAVSGVESICIDAIGQVERMGTGIGYSLDAGINWEYISQPVDPMPNEGQYQSINWGGQSLTALSITTAIHNISYDLAIIGDYIYTTSWAGGLRRFNYTINNPEWEIIPLPMDSQDVLNCGQIDTNTYVLNPMDPPNGSHNHKGFSVYFDGEFIWVGTANGINRGTITGNCIDWVHFTSLEHGFSGNWVIEFISQQINNIDRIWAITWSLGSNENYGLSYTDNEGESWSIIEDLQNIFVYSLTVNEQLFASTESGLYSIDDTTINLIEIVSVDQTTYASIVSPYIDIHSIWFGTPTKTLRKDLITSNWETYDFPDTTEIIECPLYGCNDPEASNYNSEATIDDGSCEYLSVGDINEDTILDILDIVLMVNIILDGEYNSMADINEDEIVDILDIVLLVNIILGDDEVNTVTDIDGNIYETVQIGEQLWMAENLKVTHYNNGDEIPTPFYNVEWIELTSGGYFSPSDSIFTGGFMSYDIFSTYGILYNWYALDDERGICPEEFHIPSDDEWIVLTGYLGGESVAGGRMKSTGAIEDGDGFWYSPNLGATNESGFTANPSGFRDDENGYYNMIGGGAYFWSSSEYYDENNISQVLTINAWNMSIYSDLTNLFRFSNSKQNGFSARCIAN